MSRVCPWNANKFGLYTLNPQNQPPSFCEIIKETSWVPMIMAKFLWLLRNAVCSALKWINIVLHIVNVGDCYFVFQVGKSDLLFTLIRRLPERLLCSQKLMDSSFNGLEEKSDVSQRNPFGGESALQCIRRYDLYFYFPKIQILNNLISIAINLDFLLNIV